MSALRSALPLASAGAACRRFLTVLYVYITWYITGAPRQRPEHGATAPFTAYGSMRRPDATALQSTVVSELTTQRTGSTVLFSVLWI